MKFLIALSLIVLTVGSHAKMKVVTLSPLLADLAKHVGGEHVTVIDLMGVNGDPHTFQPTPKKLATTKDASIYLASGKNLESYLPKLKSIVGNKATIVEIGRKIPSLKISGDSAIYACCPKHSHGSIDPHWWHSLENWRRACTIVEKEFSKLDPANAASYKSHSSTYRKQLSSLRSWSKKEVAKIPRSRRTLTTAHAAFGYFCKEYGFRSIPLQGLNKEQSASPQYVAEAIAAVKKNNVAAIFPEKGANTKGLQTIAKSTGAKIAPALYADTSSSISGMFKHNINTITNALR